MKAVILAGGKGSRLDNWTKDKNKCMIRLFEKPLIEYNLDHAVEAGVSEIIIILYYKPQEIIRYIGRNYKGIKVSYIVEKKGEGLVVAVENAKEKIGKSDFILMLGDEVVVNPNLKQMIKKFKQEELFAVCGIVFEESKESIGKTYTAMTNETGRAFRLIEKPKVKINNIKGTGHCVLKNEMLDYIERTPINAIRGQKELVDWIQVAIDDGKEVHIYPVTNNYTNINTKEDYNLAKEMIKKNNPKVLIVHNQMKYYGGAELLIVELANHLTKMGIKNDILALNSSKKVDEDLINTDVITFKHDIDLRPPGYKNMKDIFKAIYVFRKKLSEIKDNYDVINFHDFPVTWSLWPKKKPSVWYMNQPPGLWSKPDAGLFYKILHQFRIKLDKKIIRDTIDTITVADPFNQMRAKQRYGRNSQIVYCGINYDFFSKGNAERARKKFNLKNKFILMQSGILTGVKNQLESIKTVNKLKNKIPNILLILTGRYDDVDYKKKIDNYIKENKLEKYVLFAGNLKTREELRDLYKTADIGLFPIGKQGGWLAPFEMLCAGIPIIISSDMGIASLVKENDLGIVTKDYAQTILEIHNNKEKYKKQARQASHFIRDNLSWKQYAERMVREFKKVWGKYRTQ